jgi:hypothetical protein
MNIAVLHFTNDRLIAEVIKVVHEKYRMRTLITHSWNLDLHRTTLNKMEGI